MNNLQIFDNEEFGQIRTATIDGEPWFVGKDVAAALGYENTKDALAKHVGKEDKIMGSQNATPSVTDSMGRVQYPTWINESGVYSLIFGSKLQSAKRFKHWVTSEVLPTLRKTGTYTMPQAEAEQRGITRDDYLRAAGIVASCRNERLPIVIRLLERAGLEVPHIVELQADSGRDTAGETARMINMAINEYGFTVRLIERLTGISATELTRIRKGISSPKKARMRIICDAIQAEIDRIKSA